MSLLLAACSTAKDFKQITNDSSNNSQTGVPSVSETSIQLQTATAILFPSATLAPTHTATTLPWIPLEKELTYGDWYFRCEVTDVNFEIIEILPNIDATGFIVCDNFKIPAGVYDRKNNILYYWGLFPISSPDAIDHLGERGVGRLLRVFELGGTYQDANNLIGKKVAMSVNIPNSQNRSMFDTQNLGRFAGDYWGNQEAVDWFAQTGALPNENNILYPISLGLVK